MTEKTYSLILLTDGLPAIVDPEWFDRLNKYAWRAEQFHASTYAVTDIIVRGHKKKLRMHRLIAGTPPGKICHHINHLTLDNRRKNLLNLTSDEHSKLHSHSRIRVKYAKNPTIQHQNKAE